MSLNALLAVALTTSLCACGDDDDNNGETQEQNIDGGDSGVADLTPTLDDKSEQFVGAWTGNGPYTASGVNSYGLVSGLWKFKADGTWTWKGSNSYGYTYKASGTWHYNAKENLLITDSPFVWRILEVSENEWIGELMDNNKGGIHTYKRSTDFKLKASRPFVGDCYNDGFMVYDTIYNTDVASGELRAGLLYGPRGTEKDQMKKVYAAKADLTSDKSGFHVSRIKIHGLELNQKYQVYSFVEGKDGSIAYGNDKPLGIKVITPPAGGKFVGYRYQDLGSFCSSAMFFCSTGELPKEWMIINDNFSAKIVDTRSDQYSESKHVNLVFNPNGNSFDLGVLVFESSTGYMSIHHRLRPQNNKIKCASFNGYDYSKRKYITYYPYVQIQSSEYLEENGYNSVEKFIEEQPYYAELHIGHVYCEQYEWDRMTPTIYVQTVNID